MVFSGVCDLGRFPSLSTDVVNVNVFESHPALQHIRLVLPPFLHTSLPLLPPSSFLSSTSSPEFFLRWLLHKDQLTAGPCHGKRKVKADQKEWTTYPHSSSVLQRKQACSLKAPSVDLTRPTCSPAAVSARRNIYRQLASFMSRKLDYTTRFVRVILGQGTCESSLCRSKSNGWSPMGILMKSSRSRKFRKASSPDFVEVV